MLNGNTKMLQSKTSTTMLSQIKSVILEELSQKKKYEDKDIVLRKWESTRDSDYLASFFTGNFQYLGVVNKDFERNKHGLLSYSNGEQYLGYYHNNLRHKNGVYFWEPQLIKDGLYESHMYIGTWENDEKKGQGLYLSLREALNRRDFDLTDMDVYIGLIQDNRLVRGTQLLKNESSYYVYHGAFDSNGHKEDSNAYYYVASSDMLIKGRIANDHFIDGYLSYFNEEGEMTHLAFCTFNEDDTIKTVRDQSNINQTTIDIVTKDLKLFRSVILKVNYFENIYNKYKDTKDFIERNITSFSIFDDKDKFPLLITAYTDYRSSNIFRDIENLVFGEIS